MKFLLKILFSSEKLAIKVSTEVGKKVTARTIRRELKDLGLYSCTPRKVPLLSQKNIKHRLERANEWSNWTLKRWDDVLYSDETKINRFSSDGRLKVWRKPKTSLSPEHTVPTIKHGGGSLMVWGCMSSKGVGKLVFIEGIMDKIYYKRILSENLAESAEILGLSKDFIFQQDNDPKHKSKFVQEFFVKNGINVLEWPSQSPDLNPIEHLWDHVKREVRKVAPKNLGDLKEKVLEIWNGITPEMCRKLVHSMSRRVEEVIRVKGRTTSF